MIGPLSPTAMIRATRAEHAGIPGRAGTFFLSYRSTTSLHGGGGVGGGVGVSAQGGLFRLRLHGGRRGVFRGME